MIHILLIVIGIVLIVVNRDIKNERADDGGSFANILKNEEKEFTDYDMKFVDMRKDMAESILDLQKEIQELRTEVFNIENSNVNIKENIKQVKLDNDIKRDCIDKDIISEINFNNLISGFATLTYINPDTNEFGAVAHSINIGNSKKIPIKRGCISCTNNLSIKKSRKGSVGCINATKNNAIGEFNNNTTFGIKGEINNINLSNYKKYKVASINEVKLGKAQIILQNKNNVCKKYDIEIINIEHQKKADSKGIKIKITDPLLLKETGGIVQGMSGTPIIQDNKIVGAVSHALENNPSIGYGVYIKWMLEYNK